jgi:hypothetical protein
MKRFIARAAALLLLGSAVPALAAEPVAEVATIAQLRTPLHDIELHSRAILAEGRQPKGFLTFLRAYADLRDRLDTSVSKGDHAGAVATAREDLRALQRLAGEAGLHDFDGELARCEAALN